MDSIKIKAPGLKWRSRAGGVAVPYWVARASAVAAGYPLRTANLALIPLDQLADRCAQLEAEMVSWLSGPRERGFDGTLGSLLRLYESHEDSPFRNLKPSSHKAYDGYLARLARVYGDVRIDRLTGLDVKRWHKTWLGEDNRVGAATMALSVLKSAVSFGRSAAYPTAIDSAPPWARSGFHAQGHARLRRPPPTSTRPAPLRTPWANIELPSAMRSNSRRRPDNGTSSGNGFAWTICGHRPSRMVPTSGSDLPGRRLTTIWS
jgi:hypothetical protein